MRLLQYDSHRLIQKPGRLNHWSSAHFHASYGVKIHLYAYDVGGSRDSSFFITSDSKYLLTTDSKLTKNPCQLSTWVWLAHKGLAHQECLHIMVTHQFYIFRSEYARFRDDKAIFRQHF